MKKEEELKVFDLRDNKDTYMAIVLSNDPDSRKTDRLTDLYCQWTKAYTDVYTSLLMHAGALKVQQNALKDHKIDPYIAGGAVNGAFGPVSGVMAGLSAQSHNQKVDENREKANALVNNSAQTLAAKEGNLIFLTNSIYSLLDGYPEAVRTRNNYYRDKQIEQRFKEAEKEKEKKDSILGIIVVSAVLAFFIDLISGVMFISLTAAVSVFLIAWVISIITLCVMGSKNGSL